MTEVTIPIRWRDVDNYGHVNNAVYLTYLEEARDRWAHETLGPEADWKVTLSPSGNRLAAVTGAGTVRLVATDTWSDAQLASPLGQVRATSDQLSRRASAPRDQGIRHG